MSLFGTGRSEGVAAVLLVGLATAAVHSAAGHWGGLPLPNWAGTAGCAALGGMLAYRFLRAQGRSRYAGFLGGLTYGLTPLFPGLALAPREQLAAALAPLALEAAQRCHVPSQRRRWLPWVGLCLALLFAAGPTIIAGLASALCLARFAHTLAFGDRSEGRPQWLGFLLAAGAGGAAAANLVWLDPFGPVLGPATAPAAAMVVGGGRAAAELDAIAVVRLIGPWSLWFAVLGLLRRQQHVSSAWWLLGLAGAAPALVAALPDQAAAAWSAALPALPAMAFWLTVLAATVLGTAGLDDFLDLPMRRRTAALWLLAATLVAAPLLGIDGAGGQAARLLPLAAALVGLAVLTPCWRRLGILRFKNVLAVASLVVLIWPNAPLGAPPPPAFCAAPLGEAAAAPWTAAWQHLDRPWWHYAGLGAALLAGLISALFGCCRRR